MNKYYYADSKDGSCIGPYDVDTLKGFVERRVIDEHTMILRDGTDHWRELGNIENLERKESTPTAFSTQNSDWAGAADNPIRQTIKWCCIVLSSVIGTAGIFYNSQGPFGVIVASLAILLGILYLPIVAKASVGKKVRINLSIIHLLSVLFSITNIFKWDRIGEVIFGIAVMQLVVLWLLYLWFKCIPKWMGQA